MSEEGEIQIILLDDESSSNDFIPENEEYSAVNQCQSSIERLTTSEADEIGNPSNVSELKNKPEYQTLLKRIKFNIETMNRSELENFCFTKIKSEIESRSMYEWQMKEIKTLNDKLKVSKQELSTAKEENLRLVKSLKRRGRIVEKSITQQFFVDAHVQVDMNEFVKEELDSILPDIPSVTPCTSNHLANTLTRKPIIKLRDFCKDKSFLNTNLLNNCDKTPLPPSSLLNTMLQDNATNMGLALDNTNPHNLYYLVSVPPGDVSPKNNLESTQTNSQPLVLPKDQLPPFLSMDGNFQNSQQMVFSFGANEFSFPASLLPASDGRNVPQPPRKDQLYNYINNDIVVKTENLLEIQNMDGVQTSETDKNIDIEENLPHALITCTDKSNLQKEQNVKDSRHIEVFKVVRSIDLTEGKKLNDNSNNLMTSSDGDPFGLTMPLIVSTISLAPNAIGQISLVNNDNTDSSGLPVIVSAQSLAPLSSAVTTDNSICELSDNNKVDSSNKSLSTTVGKHTVTNSETLAISRNNESQQLGVSTSSTCNTTTPITTKTVIRKGINFGIIRPGSFTYQECSNNQTSQEAPSLLSFPNINSQTSSNVPPTITPQPHNEDGGTKHPDKINLPTNTPTIPKNKSTDTSKEPATKKICIDSNWSFDELERQITDKFYDAFNKGNLANGISIKLDVNGTTKVVTCTNINISSLQKMVDEQNYEKKSFVNVFSKAIFNKINKSVGLEQSKKITIRRCDLLDKSVKDYSRTKSDNKNKKKPRSQVIVLED